MEGTRGRAVLAAAVLSAVLAAGCFEHTVQVGAGAPSSPVIYDHWESFWLSGLVGHVRVDVERMCPSGDATIEMRQTFLNGLVAGLTSGIYTPTTLRIRCRGGRRAAMELSAEDVERIVSGDAFEALVAAEMPERLAEVAEARAALARP